MRLIGFHRIGASARRQCALRAPLERRQAHLSGRFWPTTTPSTCRRVSSLARAQCRQTVETISFHWLWPYRVDNRVTRSDGAHPPRGCCCSELSTAQIGCGMSAGERAQVPRELLQARSRVPATADMIWATRERRPPWRGYIALLIARIIAAPPPPPQAHALLFMCVYYSIC